MCSDEQRREHQKALVQYICSDAMRQRLFDVEAGRVQSRYRTEYYNTIHRRGGVLKLCRGFGPLTDNQQAMRHVVLVHLIVFN